jgi:hypothetical protein
LQLKNLRNTGELPHIEQSKANKKSKDNVGIEWNK